MSGVPFPYLNIEMAHKVVIVRLLDDTKVSENPEHELPVLIFGKLLDIGLGENYKPSELGRRRCGLKCCV